MEKQLSLAENLYRAGQLIDRTQTKSIIQKVLLPESIETGLHDYDAVNDYQENLLEIDTLSALLPPNTNTLGLIYELMRPGSTEFVVAFIQAASELMPNFVPDSTRHLNRVNSASGAADYRLDPNNPIELAQELSERSLGFNQAAVPILALSAITAKPPEQFCKIFYYVAPGILDAATEVVTQFNSPASTSKEILERMQKLYPTKPNKISAWSILAKNGGFKIKTTCPLTSWINQYYLEYGDSLAGEYSERFLNRITQ